MEVEVFNPLPIEKKIKNKHVMNCLLGEAYLKKKIIHKANKIHLKDRKADLNILLKHLVSPQLFYCNPMVFFQTDFEAVMQLKSLEKHIFVLY